MWHHWNALNKFVPCQTGERHLRSRRSPLLFRSTESNLVSSTEDTTVLRPKSHAISCGSESLCGTRRARPGAQGGVSSSATYTSDMPVIVLLKMLKSSFSSSSKNLSLHQSKMKWSIETARTPNWSSCEVLQRRNSPMNNRMNYHFPTNTYTNKTVGVS